MDEVRSAAGMGRFRSIQEVRPTGVLKSQAGPALSVPAGRLRFLDLVEKAPEASSKAPAKKSPQKALPLTSR